MLGGLWFQMGTNGHHYLGKFICILLCFVCVLAVKQNQSLTWPVTGILTKQGYVTGNLTDNLTKPSYVTGCLTKPMYDSLTKA